MAKADFIEKQATRTMGSAKNRGREKAYVHDPLAVNPVYERGRYSPKGVNHADGDGLQTKALHDREVILQRPQFTMDGHLGETTSYDKDGRLKSHNPGSIAGDTMRGLRGGDQQGGGYSCFDHVGNPGMAKGGGKLKASGKDEHKSPFSAAYRKGSGEGF